MAKLSILTALGLLVWATGCATVVRGEKQKIDFKTDPPGATVKVDEAVVGNTPCQAQLKRKDEHKVTITKAGYQGVTFTMRSTWDGASLPGFAVPGGSASVATDRATGADLSFYNVEKITLKKMDRSGQPAVLEMFHYRGKLYTKDEFERVMEEERLERFRHREP